jgi:hypothetical protein
MEEAAASEHLRAGEVEERRRNGEALHQGGGGTPPQSTPREVPAESAWSHTRGDIRRFLSSSLRRCIAVVKPVRQRRHPSVSFVLLPTRPFGVTTGQSSSRQSQGKGPVVTPNLSGNHS